MKLGLSECITANTGHWYLDVNLVHMSKYRKLTWSISGRGDPGTI